MDDPGFDEEWKAHPYHKDIMVSSYGKVRSYKGGAWRDLHPSSNNMGYLRVGIGHGNPCSVHVLVAETFVYNDWPEGKTQVNHVDGYKHNNCSYNLEWTTASENIQHAIRTGLKPAPEGRTIRIVETGNVYDSISECARAIGGIRKNVSACLTGRKHTHRGFHFEYVDG